MSGESNDENALVFFCVLSFSVALTLLSAHAPVSLRAAVR
jgi:hypothetical protein